MTSPAPLSHQHLTIVKSQVSTQVLSGDAARAVTAARNVTMGECFQTARAGLDAAQPHAYRPRTEAAATVVVVSPAGKILWSSEVLAPVLGYAAFALWGHWIQELMEEVNTAALPSVLSPLGSSTSGVTGLRLRLRHLDGSIRTAVGTAKRIDDPLSGCKYVLRFRIENEEEEESVVSNDPGSYFTRVRFT